ncbi:MAG: hypothetical protein AAF039_09700 [Bacteroidota bacterium]
MIVEFSPYFPEGEVSFNVQYKEHRYSVTVSFFPYECKDREEIIKMDIRDILTPVVHIQYNVLDIDTSIYQSYFLMPSHAMYIEETMPQGNINKIAKMIVDEIGFEGRIDAYIQKNLCKSQLSLF